VFYRPIGNLLGVLKIGRERGEGILTPNELDLSFVAANDCAKFHRIRFKIETAEAMTDTQTDACDLIICPMPCYINGTDLMSV